jgi:cytochrome b-561
MLAYKTVPGTKSFKKLVHLTLQFLAFCLSLIGFWAALKFHNDKGIDNFYSLHSWLGLACLFLFSIQVFSLFVFIPFLDCPHALRFFKLMNYS